MDVRQDTKRVAPSKARVRLSTPALAAGHRSAKEFVVSSRARSMPGGELPLVRGAFELDLQGASRAELVITCESRVCWVLGAARPDRVNEVEDTTHKGMRWCPLFTLNVAECASLTCEGWGVMLLRYIYIAQTPQFAPGCKYGGGGRK
eukprot:1133081-Prymnesium_polylepis.1